MASHDWEMYKSGGSRGWLSQGRFDLAQRKVAEIDEADERAVKAETAVNDFVKSGWGRYAQWTDPLGHGHLGSGWWGSDEWKSSNPKDREGDISANTNAILGWGVPAGTALYTSVAPRVRNKYGTLGLKWLAEKVGTPPVEISLPGQAAVKTAPTVAKALGPWAGIALGAAMTGSAVTRQVGLNKLDKAEAAHRAAADKNVADMKHRRLLGAAGEFDQRLFDVMTATDRADQLRLYNKYMDAYAEKYGRIRAVVDRNRDATDARGRRMYDGALQWADDTSAMMRALGKAYDTDEGAREYRRKAMIDLAKSSMSSFLDTADDETVRKLEGFEKVSADTLRAVMSKTEGDAAKKAEFDDELAERIADAFLADRTAERHYREKYFPDVDKSDDYEY